MYSALELNVIMYTHLEPLGGLWIIHLAHMSILDTLLLHDQCLKIFPI